MPTTLRASPMIGNEPHETCHRPTASAAHPAYLRIIGMGAAAVPLILERMASKPGFWFAALRSITGVDPVQPHEHGDMDAMTRAWRSWGRQHGNCRS